METHTIIEAALKPLNERLELVVYKGDKNHSNESGVLHILTLMANIRTVALEQGWGPWSDSAIDKIHSALLRLEMNTRI